MSYSDNYLTLAQHCSDRPVWGNIEHRTIDVPGQPLRLPVTQQHIRQHILRIDDLRFDDTASLQVDSIIGNRKQYGSYRADSDDRDFSGPCLQVRLERVGNTR